MTPAISIQRLYFTQFVGSGKVPWVTPHWKGATVVGAAVVVGEIDVVGTVVVDSTGVEGVVAGQFPSTHKFFTGSK